MNPEIDPAFILRAYIWAVLKANDPEIWDTEKYGGRIPIVPVGEEPDLSQYSGPNIVYVATPGHAPIPYRRASATFVIGDPNTRQLMKTLNVLVTALDREDETARDVNRFSTAQSGFKGLRFGYIRMSFAEGPLPGEQEAGRNYAAISVEYEYFVDYAIQTTVM